MAYRDGFLNARLNRSKSGVLEVECAGALRQTK
jgi:hypothetical protein